MDVAVVSRSRSRTRTPAKRSLRSRSSRGVVARVPRSLRYNGVYQITREVNTNIDWPQWSSQSAAGDIGYAFSASGKGITNLGLRFFINQIEVIGKPYGSSTNVGLSTSIPGATELASLWEYVKIDKVELRFICQNQDSTAVVINANAAPEYFPQPSLPLMFVSTDYSGIDDLSISQTQQQNFVKHIKLDDSWKSKYTVYPKCNEILQYTGATFNNNATRPYRGFISAGTDIPHYGVRFSVANIAKNVMPHTLSIFCKYYFSVKNVR